MHEQSYGVNDNVKMVIILHLHTELIMVDHQLNQLMKHLMRVSLFSSFINIELFVLFLVYEYLTKSK
jgi:hypothetical protein